MSVLLFSLSALCALETFAQSGWSWQNPLPQGNSLLGVFCTDADRGMVVGDCSTILRTTTGGLTWIREDPKVRNSLPGQIALSQNYPNPFDSSTAIRFDLPSSAHVFLRVYDMLGREQAVLLNGRVEAGAHQVKFDCTKLASGAYFYGSRLEISFIRKS